MALLTWPSAWALITLILWLLGPLTAAWPLPLRTLLVSAGNAYLENALALLPRLELYGVTPAGYCEVRAVPWPPALATAWARASCR